MTTAMIFTLPAASALSESPLFGLSLTICWYALGLWLRAHVRWMHPLVTACVGTLVTLWLLSVPLEHYRVGGDILTLILGPATVALAVPLYRHARQLRAALVAVLAGVITGSAVGLASGAGLVLLARGGEALVWSMMPKSATTAISMELSRVLGGVPELTAALTVLTGLLGSLLGPRFLRLCGIRQNAALGVAMGTGSHGIGTARILSENAVSGSFAALSMGLTGLVTTLMVWPLASR